MTKRNDIIEFLKNFKTNNALKHKLKRIGIFGSVARDQFRPHSDIDIVVELEKQDLFILIDIKQELEQSLGSKVDIVSYRNRMNAFLKRRIDQEAVYV